VATITKKNLVIDEQSTVGSNADPLRTDYDSGWEFGYRVEDYAFVLGPDGQPVSFLTPTTEMPNHEQIISRGGRRKVLLDFQRASFRYPERDSVPDSFAERDADSGELIGHFGKCTQEVRIFADPEQFDGYTDWLEYVRTNYGNLVKQQEGDPYRDIFDHSHEYRSPLSLSEEQQVGASVQADTANVRFDYNFYTQPYESIVDNPQVNEDAIPEMYYFYLDSQRLSDIETVGGGPEALERLNDDRYTTHITANGNVDEAWTSNLRSSNSFIDRSRYLAEWSSNFTTQTSIENSTYPTDKYKNVIIPVTTLDLLEGYNAYSNLFPMFADLDFKLPARVSGRLDSSSGDSSFSTFMNSQRNFSIINNLMRDSLFQQHLERESVYRQSLRFREKHQLVTNDELTDHAIIGDGTVERFVFDLDDWILDGGITGLVGGSPAESLLQFMNNDHLFMKNYSTDGIYDKYADPSQCDASCFNLREAILNSLSSRATGGLLRTYEQLLGDAGYNNSLAYHESVFFKITKYEITPNGARGAPIKRTYLPNTRENRTKVRFIDTQAKYNKQYEYEVTVYNLVFGSRTRYTRVEIFSNPGSIRGFPIPYGRADYGIIGATGRLHVVSTEPTAGPMVDTPLGPVPGPPQQYGDPVGEPYTIEYSEQPASINTPFMARVFIDTFPSIKLIEVPYVNYSLSNSTFGRGTMLDNPPMPPEVSIVSYRGIDNKLLLNLNSGIGSREFMPISFGSDEAQYFERLRNNNLPLRNTVLYESDDPSVDFEIFRLDKMPTSLQDFSNARRMEVSTQTEETGFVKVSSTSHIDSINPNTKYYYLFRSKDVHGHPSYPTQVYEVELVEIEGAIFPRISTIQLEQPSDRITKTKKMTRFLQIKPQLSHILFDQEQADRDYTDPDGDTGPPTTAPWGQEIPMGVNEVPIWGKKFKIRLTSKKSGKKIDLNISFSKEYENDTTSIGETIDGSSFGY
jgi:hypothetical protein